MSRKRIKLVVEVDLDPTPGAFHTEESAIVFIEGVLKGLIPHYNPAIELANDDESDNEQKYDKAWAQKHFEKELKYACPREDCLKPVGVLCDTTALWVHLERLLASIETS